MPDAAPPKWIELLQERDPEFAEGYLALDQRVMKDGAIPAKYKILMTMVVDAVVAHPDGCAALANKARAAGATEEEISEAVAVAYKCGGTPALVVAVNAFRG